MYWESVKGYSDRNYLQVIAICPLRERVSETRLFRRVRQTGLDADRRRIFPYRDQPSTRSSTRTSKSLPAKERRYSNNAPSSHRLDLVLPPSGCHCDRVVEAIHTASAWPASLFVLYVTTQTAQPAPTSIVLPPLTPSISSPIYSNDCSLHQSPTQNRTYTSLHSKPACSRVTGRGSDRGCSAIRPTGNEPRLVRRL
jgi:hypothetical protein